MQKVEILLVQIQDYIIEIKSKISSSSKLADESLTSDKAESYFKNTIPVGKIEEGKLMVDRKIKSNHKLPRASLSSEANREGSTPGKASFEKDVANVISSPTVYIPAYDLKALSDEISKVKTIEERERILKYYLKYYNAANYNYI